MPRKPPADIQAAQSSKLLTNLKTISDQTNLQLLLAADEESAQADAGFLVKQLMMSLQWAQTRRDKRLAAELAASTGKKEKWTPLPKWTTDNPCANKLLGCIAKILETTAKRRNQEKLQDFVLEFLTPPKKLVQPKIINIEEFVAARQMIWQTAQGGTEKWQGRHAVPPDTLPKTGRLENGGLQNMMGKTGAIVSTASADSAAFYEKNGIDRCRKDMDVATSIKKLQKRNPEALRSRFGVSELRGAERGADVDDDTMSLFSDVGESNEFTQLPRADKLKSAAKLLEQNVGESTMCRTVAAPQLVNAFPLWKDFNQARRTKHRIVGRGFEERYKTDGCFGDVGCSCGLCKHKSKALLDGSQGVIRRVYSKPIMSQSSFDIDKDMGAMLQKSRVKPMPKCGSLPALQLPGSGAIQANGAIGEQPDPVEPPYERLPVKKNGFAVDNSVQLVQSGIWRYLQECQRTKTTPKLMRLLLDEALQQKQAIKDGTAMPGMPQEGGLFLDLGNKGLFDANLDPIIEAAIKVNRVNGIDLSQNGLSDKAVASFLQRVPARTATILDLSDLAPRGSRTKTISSVCANLDSWFLLTTLKIKGCRIGTDAQWSELTKAIAEQGSIKELCLAETQLGYAKQKSVESVAELMSNSLMFLERLDISGNFLYYEGFEYLCQHLLKAKTLKVLDVSHNANFHYKLPRRLKPLANQDAMDETLLSDEIVDDPVGIRCEDLPCFNPVALLCEAVADCKTLTDLHICNSSVDYTADCALLTSLLYNKTLKRLDITYNPHGDMGLRALLRLMMLNDTLEHIDARHFDEGSPAPGTVTTDLGTPKGQFNLELSHPQHRALLRWLLYKARVAKRKIDDTFEVINWSKKGDWYWKKKGDMGFGIATVGRLEFNFEIPVPIEKEKTPAAAVAKWQNTRRMPIPLAKAVPLFVLYDELDTWRQKETFIRAVSQTLTLKVAQLLKFIKSSPQHATETARHLFGNVPPSDPMLFFDLVRQEQMAKRFRVEAGNVFTFNVANPTSRYFLELEKPLDRAVAEKLRIVNEYERLKCEKKDAPDVSQHGNHEGARNMKQEASQYTSFNDFDLEQTLSGRFWMDYASPPLYVPTNKESPSPNIFIDDIIDMMETCDAGQTDKVRALRSVSHQLILSPDQVHRFCRLFRNPATKRPAKKLWGIAKRVFAYMCRRKEHKTDISVIARRVKKDNDSAFSQEYDNPRVEVFVMLFNRCPDWHLLCTAECLYDPGLFTLHCSSVIRDRLGHLRTMDVMQCDRPWRLYSVGAGKAVSSMSDVSNRLISAESASTTSRPGTKPTPAPSQSGSKEQPKAEQGEAKPERIEQLQTLREAIENGMDEKKASWDMEPGRRYEFDLTKYEDRRCLQLLCELNTKEEAPSGGGSIVRCKWSENEEEGYDFEIPNEWTKEDFLRPPAAPEAAPEAAAEAEPVPETDAKGTFECTYMSETDKCASKKERRALGQTFCGWQKKKAQ